MDRRALLSLLGVGALGLASAPVVARAGDPHPHHHDPEHGDCLKACLRAAEVCNETFHYSFGHLKDGHAEHARIAELTIDCQDFCKLAAGLLARESSMIGPACLACAEVCQVCAAECQKHDDTQMKECLAATLACEKSCRLMADRARNGKQPA